MASTDRAQTVIPWIMRRDLEVLPADESLGAWTIKDPVRLTYFRVESTELEFLRMLDGQRSLESVVQQLTQDFSGMKFSKQNLATFLMTAVRAGLLIPVQPGYGSQLAAQARSARTTAIVTKLFSLISHRFRGIDPTGLLKVLDRRLGWLYHPRILLAGGMFVVVTACMVLLRWSQLQAELPKIGELLTIQHALSLGLIIAVIKLLHEIGHGLTCCHYGGECHEMGCIVVGFLPLLYCDVSDSWRERNRGHRIQVAAAGIVVELFLAAVFGVLWMASVPGFLHAMFLNVMLVCSLNTILVNGNPLLRYDGYYVLSDALRFPNLGPESRRAATAVVDRLILGLSRPEELRYTGLSRIAVPVFGAVSLVYRVFVLVAILLLVHGVLKPYRLEGIVWMFAASVSAGMLWGVFSLIRQRLRLILPSAPRRQRAAVGLVMLLVLLGTSLFWPLPYSIEVPFTLTPGVNSPVYVSAAGAVEESPGYGAHVRQEQLLAQLRNPQLILLVVQLEGELELREVRLQHLTTSRSTSKSSAMAIPAARKAVQNTQQRLQTARRKAERLRLLSPRSGQLYPPRSRLLTNESQLTPGFWQGTPLAAENHAAWLEEQTLIGWVGSEAGFRAHAFVPQESVEFMAENAFASLTFNSKPGQPVSGTVEKIGSQPETSVPPELAVTGMLAVRQLNGLLSDTRFVVHVRLDVSQRPVPPLYATGFARIVCAPRSLASRCWRLLSHTFAFEL